MREAHGGVFHRGSKHAASHQVIIERHADVESALDLLIIPTIKIQIVSPARVEKLPLQLGKLVQLCAVLSAHSRFVQRNKERGDDNPLRVLQSMQQIE